MKLKELQTLIQELIDEGHADKEVQIRAMTGRLSNDSHVSVKAITPGFDWDASRVLIHPEETLVSGELYKKKKEKGRMVGAARGADNESNTHGYD
jgi:hypothetical protein